MSEISKQGFNMSRPRKNRCISVELSNRYFKPRAIPLSNLEEVVLSPEEMEALRLKEIKRLDHNECARKMKISRTSFHRDLESAHRKIADALVNGKAIRIESNSKIYNNKLK